MTFPEIPIPQSIDYTSAVWEENRLMGKIYNAAEYHERRLLHMQNVAELLESQEAVEKWAHLTAINEISELAFNFLYQQLAVATYETKEYNIAIFTERMNQALIEHKENLITIPADKPGFISVYINMELLGDPEEYTSAANSARKSMGIGKIPDPRMRSKIWAEKIYGVDREGRSIIKDGEDITEKYIGKYTQTILERLAEIDPTSAPWWYFINYGNVDLMAEDQGIPYPVIAPTHFIEKAQTAIESAFYELYNRLLTSAEQIYGHLFGEDFGEEGFTGTIDEVILNSSDIDLNDLLEKAVYAETNKTIETMTYNNSLWDIYVTSRGNLARRYNLRQE
jgi:hypothetical protein